ncbi:acyl carrier protein [Alphaproteobacteria bacterium]|nr:acyl carrier protein [Alphaproteobacteria bacterium]MDC1120366.1 acyl carrier protein [Alphaproteobacteria bacterium]
MRDDILEKMNDIFQTYFDDETIHLQESTTAADIDEWDSLAQVGLILIIERTFSLKFSMDEIDKLADVGEMVALIDAKS